MNFSRKICRTYEYKRSAQSLEHRRRPCVVVGQDGQAREEHDQGPDPGGEAHPGRVYLKCAYDARMRTHAHANDKIPQK